MRKKLQLLAMLLLVTCGALAQQVINGTVKSSNGEALIGASVTVKGTSTGTNTDLDGKYSIEVPNNAVLQFAYLGFISKEVPVNGKTTVNVTLEENAEQLSQVVVTALGISRDEKSLTYAAQQVSGDELTAVKDVNFVNSLSGKAAGVFIKKSASGVGGSAKVVLRGPSSTGNNNVLYVIDGIPMFNYSPAQPTDVWGSADGVASAGRDGGDGISNINPEDVKSISILKGASAAALYGSQAANGVILITTKRGQAGRMAINISSNFVTQSVLEGPELQFQYGQTKEGSLDSWGSKLSSPTADFVDDFFQNGKTWINSISLSGGTETAQTYFSYANTHASGIMPTSGLNKHNFTFRETAQFLNNKLHVSANINFINQRAENRSSSGLYYNPLTGLYFFPRGLDFNSYKNNFETFSSERNINVQNWVSDKDDQQNPFWILNRNPTFNTRNRLISTVSAKFQLNDWLSVQMRGNVDKSFDAYDQRSYASTQATLAESNGRYVLQKVEGTQFYGDLMLNASKNFNEFSINATLGSVISDNRQAVDLFDSKGANLSFANVFSLQNINQPGAIINQTLIRNQLQSVLASVNLGYKRMLYLDITGRNDWSSTLAFTGNESFFYPSVGVSGVLTEIFDMKGIDFAKNQGFLCRSGQRSKRL